MYWHLMHRFGRLCLIKKVVLKIYVRRLRACDVMMWHWHTSAPDHHSDHFTHRKLIHAHPGFLLERGVSEILSTRCVGRRLLHSHSVQPFLAPGLLVRSTRMILDVREVREACSTMTTLIYSCGSCWTHSCLHKKIECKTKVGDNPCDPSRRN